MVLQSFLLDLGRFFSFLILYEVCRTPWTGDEPVARPLPTHRTQTQISMPSVWFEPTISVFERSKTVHTLDTVATVISSEFVLQRLNSAKVLCVIQSSLPKAVKGGYEMKCVTFREDLRECIWNFIIPSPLSERVYVIVNQSYGQLRHH
jgi:hypothetical protein